MSNENGPVHMEGLWEALAAPEGPWLSLCTVLPEIRRWAFSSLDVSDTQGHRKDSNLGLCDCMTGSEPQTGTGQEQRQSRLLKPQGGANGCRGVPRGFLEEVTPRQRRGRRNLGQRDWSAQR